MISHITRESRQVEVALRGKSNLIGATPTKQDLGTFLWFLLYRSQRMRK